MVSTMVQSIIPLTNLKQPEHAVNLKHPEHAVTVMLPGMVPATSADCIVY